MSKRTFGEERAIMQQKRLGQAIAPLARLCLPRLWAAGLVVASLAGAPGARAEESLQNEEASASGGQLQEIIVYARRREERIEDTPLAISVRTGEELREESAVLIEDIGRDVPNVRMVSSPQSVSALDVTMRGQTVNRSAIMFDPAVGLYIDGVYVANGQGAMATLLDVDSVEVIRGSQGTLFGRNNTGGSILLLTHRPDLQQSSAQVAVSGGDYGSFMDRAIVNLPLGSDFAVRLAYQGNDRSGFGSSIGSGQDDFENQHRYQARFGALWRPADATEVYFTYERFQARESGAILHPLTGPPPGTLVSLIGTALGAVPIPGLPTVAFPSDLYQTDGSFPAFDNARTDNLQLTTTQKLDGALALKLILGYRHLDASTALDVDATTLPLADTTLFNTSNQKSAELQLNDKVLNDRLDWVAGLYWFQDNGSAPSVQSPASPQFLAAVNQFDTVTGGVPFTCPPQAPPGSLCPLAPLFSPLPVYEQNSITNRSIAAYLHGEYQLTPDWAAAAGLRRTGDRRELAENSFVNIPGFGESCTILDTTLPPPYRVTGPCPAVDKSVSYGFWSWEFSSRYRLSPELNTYLRIGRSQRSGGWNAPLATLQDQPFRPEKLTDYELGLKADLLGGALTVNGDVFYGKYDDMQRLLARLNPDGTPVTLVTNAGRARISGSELEALWRVTARASLQSSFGWTDARYQTFLYQPLANGPVQDLSGNEFYQTPRLQGDFSGSYLMPTTAGDWMVRADYAWQDKVEFNVINDFNYQPAYGTVNGRIAFASRTQTWELALWGLNLADKHYAYTGGTLGAPLSPIATIAWQVPGARRTAGLEGTYRWIPAR
jgi:iron complex outermembrane recepter protein